MIVADRDARAAARLTVRLHQLGHRVQLACTPAEILHAARTEYLDLVLADTELATGQESDWIECLLALPDAPALALMCERPSLAMAIRAANLPLAGYLAKPLPHARIDELVRGAQGRLRRTDVMSRETTQKNMSF